MCNELFYTLNNNFIIDLMDLPLDNFSIRKTAENRSKIQCAYKKTYFES